MKKITIRFGGEFGEPREVQVVVLPDGEVRLVEPGEDPMADPLYVGSDWEDVVSQVTYDGHVIEKDGEGNFDHLFSDS